MNIFTVNYVDQFAEMLEQLNIDSIDLMASKLATVRNSKGRLFILGVGGSAGTASHAVNDFRKIAGIEAYTPVDNVSELTARVNDEGWDTSFVAWLHGSNLNQNDTILVFSVGGGDLNRNVSPNIVHALYYAKDIGCTILSIVGKDGGYAKKVSDVSVLIPTINEDLITPFVESAHSVILHLLVSHPFLKIYETKWESVKKEEKELLK